MPGSLRPSARPARIVHLHTSPDRRRRLRLESLEERCVLSTLDPCSADAPPTAIVAAAPAETGESIGPLELDSYYAALGVADPSAALPAAEGEGPGAAIPPTSAPPTIVEFSARRVESYWIISGRVADDYSMAGMSVCFGEYLDGQFATVQADGTFSYYAYAPPGATAELTAIAVDLHGNKSAEVSTVLPA